MPEDEIAQTQLFRMSANLVKEKCWLLVWRHIFTRYFVQHNEYKKASTDSEQVME